MAKTELSEFLLQSCKERYLSLRSLSMKAGLSPGTVHSIIKREYQPNLFTLNRLADYLGVKRPYLWQLAGLLEDMDYAPESTIGDPQLRYHFAQADKLPEPARKLAIDILRSILSQFGQSEEKTKD